MAILQNLSSSDTFLAFYLNAKLKAFPDYHTSIWKMFLVLSPLLGALFIAASVTMDQVSVKRTSSVKNLNSSHEAPL